MLNHFIVFVQLDQLNVVPTMHKFVCKAYVWHVALVAMLLRGKGGGGVGDARDYSQVSISVTPISVIISFMLRKFYSPTKTQLVRLANVMC